MGNSGICGYFGVIMPDLFEFQGYFIYREFDVIGLRLLETLRKNAKGKTSLVITPTQGVNAEDQAILGNICAIAIRGFLDKNILELGMAGAALKMLTKNSYFAVHGLQEGPGHLTKLEFLDAETIGEARKSLHSHPSVLGIKSALLDQLAQNKQSMSKFN